jgi:hypothetical protein
MRYAKVKRRMRGRGLMDFIGKALGFLKKHKVISKLGYSLGGMLPGKYGGVMWLVLSDLVVDVEDAVVEDSVWQVINNQKLFQRQDIHESRNIRRNSFDNSAREPWTIFNSMHSATNSWAKHTSALSLKINSPCTQDTLSSMLIKANALTRPTLIGLQYIKLLKHSMFMIVMED